MKDWKSFIERELKFRLPSSLLLRRRKLDVSPFFLMHHEEKYSLTIVIHEDVEGQRLEGVFRGESVASEGWSASERQGTEPAAGTATAKTL